MKLIKYILSILLLTLSLGVAAQETDTLSQEMTQVEKSGSDSQPQQTEHPTPSQLWDDANTAYLRNDFREAMAIYEQILDRGLVSAKLYYNLANACFKSGELGKAILYYHRSLRLNPADEDVRYNLSIAQSHTIDRIEQIPEFFLSRWMRTLRTTMSGTVWSLLSLLMLSLGLVSLLFFLLSQRLALRKAGFYFTLLCGMLFVATTLFALSDRSESLDRSSAVVLSSAVSVKSSPDNSATDLFVIHEGTLLSLGDSLDGWQEIRLEDGKKGWIENKHFESI